ncbi:dynamin family protein [Oscillatoriales cyanobacterium LEGE 11467]|uniref:Dynamin family protein n=1 Tax=Zarconia navalis LEGE 11467 TaxID=1828826 RepID=A0A928Z5U1_9CYAN|nr:dynamin family protein [Zarconia navalis]MBE9039667.1 dynamin family protein [Zarconia navalis LEGE 11467]
MTYKIVKSASFLGNLEQVAAVRTQAANCLSNIAQTLSQSQKDAKSGSLEVQREIEDMTIASENLRQGRFRLLVLGDMKRGKSTFLNALLGEKLLPSDVNPCTALLTVLRYGTDKQVTLHFNDGKPPKKLDFKTFKREYTIDPGEAKQYEQEQKSAFPDIDYAVVEYPLPLLQQGVEIVDSPGLNDTEARNELSLGYINNCHAILFVLRSTQPCTLGERRYLENYIKDRGLTVFFLVNAWDQVRESLIDPDDPEEIEEAEYKLRRVFKSNLAEYCQVEGHDFYDERVFEVSALDALRKRLKDADADLEGTGFPKFLDGLGTFLTQERAVSELRQARTLARQGNDRIGEAIDVRVSLLDRDVDQLRESIAAVEPEFEQLTSIRDRFREEIRNLRDSKAQTVADSFRSYVLNLEHTFESDFLRYQPNLNVMDVLDGNRRRHFEDSLKQTFEQYINDKIADWSLEAEREIDRGFKELSQLAARYGDDYAKVTDTMTEKLTGQVRTKNLDSVDENNAPSWAAWAMGLVSLASGKLAGAALAQAGFNWKNILLNMMAVVGIGGAITMLSGIVLGPITLMLIGLGVGALQMDSARKKLMDATKQELVKYLPQIAREQWQPVYDAVKECFDAYEREVGDRIDDDINSRKGELENLVKQKERFEIDREAEVARLQRLGTDVSDRVAQLEVVYREFLAMAD